MTKKVGWIIKIIYLKVFGKTEDRKVIRLGFRGGEQRTECKKMESMWEQMNMAENLWARKICTECVPCQWPIVMKANCKKTSTKKKKKHDGVSIYITLLKY